MRSGVDSNWRSAGSRTVSWSAISLLVLAFSSQRGYAQTPTDLVVGPTTPPPYVATNSITSSGSLVINGSAIVTFTAGSFIKLEPGFHATAGTTGTTFQAIIGTITGTQTIIFPSISAKTVGAPLVLYATATSGLPVTLTSSTTSVCTVSGTTGGTVSLLAAGTCTIVASQAGNGSYSAATSVSQSFTVNSAVSSVSVTEYIYLNGRAVAIEHTP